MISCPVRVPLFGAALVWDSVTSCVTLSLLRPMSSYSSEWMDEVMLQYVHSTGRVSPQPG